MGQEHWLLIQKTYTGFPAPTCRLTPLVAPVSKSHCPLWPLQALYARGAYIYKQTKCSSQSKKPAKRILRSIPNSMDPEYTSVTEYRLS